MTSWWAFALCLWPLLTYGMFVIFYAVRSPWSSNVVGRSLMLSKFVITILLLHVLVVLSAGDYPGRIAVWIAIFLLLGIAGTTQLVTLLRLQRRAKNDPQPRRRATDHV